MDNQPKEKTATLTDGKIADKTCNNVCYKENANIWFCSYENPEDPADAGEAVDPWGLSSLLLTMPNGAATEGPMLKAS